VTEAITGLDLVEMMIRVAAGEKLPIEQKDVQRNGWSIECRINAEDPFRNFLPSTGRLVRFQTPKQTMFQGNTTNLYGVRVDTGVQDGGEIPMFYDSMIAKLIVHGKDRNDAIAKMREALNGFVIRGISSNIPFQAALLAHPRFVSGDFNTGFIAEQYSQGFRAEDVPHDDHDFLAALAAFVRRKSRQRAANLSGQLPGYDVKVGQDYAVVELGQGGQFFEGCATGQADVAQQRRRLLNPFGRAGPPEAPSPLEELRVEARADVEGGFRIPHPLEAQGDHSGRGQRDEMAGHHHAGVAEGTAVAGRRISINDCHRVTGLGTIISGAQPDDSTSHNGHVSTHSWTGW
jgi:propionyl-CoA carboxylase alpha chain